MNVYNFNTAKIKLIIFDVDGTLYNQFWVRFCVIKSLIKYIFLHPIKYKDLAILYSFRKQRAKYKGLCIPNLTIEQYNWCSRNLKINIDYVRQVIDYWMYNFPLPYVKKYRFKTISCLVEHLHNNNIKTAVYSDHPCKDKITAMGFNFDIIISSVDSSIECLKPNPKGILFICKHFDIPVENCLIIGDRYSRDGLCAIAAGAQYYILPKGASQKGKFYLNLAKYFHQKKP